MTEVKTDFITRNIIENAYTYEEYRQLIDERLRQNKTTGENHSEGMLHYTKMNVHRMKRIDKRSELVPAVTERLGKVKRHMTWLILTEAWCGDAAQVLPVIQKMADQSDKIHSRYILRDENLPIMDRFLTDGKSRSIPVVIILDSVTLEVLGSWGPRPATAQDMYMNLKRDESVSNKEAAERLHKWYADDQTISVQEEFAWHLDTWENN